MSFATPLALNGPDLFTPVVDWTCVLPCPVCTDPRPVTLETCPRQNAWRGCTIAACANECRDLTVMEVFDLTCAARDRWLSEQARKRGHG